MNSIPWAAMKSTDQEELPKTHKSLMMNHRLHCLHPIQVSPIKARLPGWQPKSSSHADPHAPTWLLSSPLFQLLQWQQPGPLGKDSMAGGTDSKARGLCSILLYSLPELQLWQISQQLSAGCSLPPSPLLTGTEWR